MPFGGMEMKIVTALRLMEWRDEKQTRTNTGRRKLGVNQALIPPPRHQKYFLIGCPPGTRREVGGACGGSMQGSNGQ